MLAVDPTSPFSGGAILGDRVRMQHHTTDDGVFIRSMATRGHLGGLALATPQAVRVLDAVGKAWIVIETVGVGQVEVEIAGHADTTIVVVNPGWGDEVQAAKAGLLEIADIFVVNKADRPGAADDRERSRGHARALGRARVATADHRNGRHDRRRRRRALGRDRRAPRASRVDGRGRARGDAPPARRAARARRRASARPCRTRCARRRAVRSARRRVAAASAIPTPRPTRCWRGAVTEHPLAAMLDAAARGNFLRLTVGSRCCHRRPGRADAMIGFTGHFVLAATIDAAEVAARSRPRDFSVPMSASFLMWFAGSSGRSRQPSTRCSAPSAPAPVARWLHETDAADHPRVARASRYRTDMHVSDRDDAGVLVVGRGHLRTVGDRLRSRATSHKGTDWAVALSVRHGG